MLYLRRLSIINLMRFPAITFLPANRLYAKEQQPKRKPTKPKYPKMMTSAVNPDGMQVHEETLRYVNTGCHFHINSEIPLKVRISEPLEYPEGNAFIAELHGDAVKNTTASMSVVVNEAESQVDVNLKKKTEDSKFHGIFEIPLRASAKITANDTVGVAKLYGDEVAVEAGGTIYANELNATKIRLISDHGDIYLRGRLLGQDTLIETKGPSGNIYLDKLLGESLVVRTTGGTIITNSCYTNTSKFETNTGRLQLKNVHNQIDVNVLGKGGLEMSGVNGNLNVKCNGGTLNLQISELKGVCSINGHNLEEAVINISDTVEETVQISVTSKDDSITLSDSLAHMKTALNKEGNKYNWKPTIANTASLHVDISGCPIRLGKSSWADMVKATMKKPDTHGN